jgi:hypothetical protein
MPSDQEEELRAATLETAERWIEDPAYPVADWLTTLEPPVLRYMIAGAMTSVVHLKCPDRRWAFVETVVNPLLERDGYATYRRRA